VTTLNIQDIMKVLPHRYPMLLIDRIIECDDKTRIVALKNVTINEPFFNGHFPGVPVMPGVLELEAMAQAAGVLVNRISNLEGKIPFFMTIDKAKFRRVVQPGDQLRIEVELLKVRMRSVRFQARALVDGEVAAEAEMMCMITNESAK
jgi:beta-hydroxyacyl-ACP dehydratase FabZ